MPSAKRILLLDLGPTQVSVGLLLLRLIAGGTLFLKHGHEKIIYFASMSHQFPDPVGLGPVPTFIIAMISDSICSVLIMLGLATRWAAAFSFLNIFIAWDAVHHFLFLGPEGGHGELIVLYLAAFVCLFLTGPGRYSLDEVLLRRRLEESELYVDSRIIDL